MRLRRRLRAAPLFLLLGILLVWPALMLVIGVFRTSPPGMRGSWTLQPLLHALGTPGTAAAIGSAVLLALVTTVVGTGLAAGFAYLAERTDAPLRRMITPAMLIMFATPPLFYAVGYSLLANQYTGLVNAGIEAVFGDALGKVNIESWPGLLTVTSFRATAFIYLFLIGPFRALDSTHEDASLVSGVGRFGTFLRIDLPILAPALTGAAILGIMSGLQAFDTVLIIGEPAHIRVISTQIYDFLGNMSPPHYADASFLSTLLILVVGALCLLQARILGRRSFVTVSGKGGRNRRHGLRGWRWVAGTAILLYFIIAEVAPIVSLIFSSLQPFPGVYGTLTLNHYRHALALPDMGAAIRTTLTLAVVVGALGMALAVTIAQAGRRLGRRAAAALRFITLVPYAMSGIVTALAVTWAYVSLPIVRQIYGTIWLLILALVIVVMPFAMQAAQSAVAQIGAELQEAARTSGASAWRATVDVLGPLIAPSFLSGWYVAAVVVAGNLDVPLVLGAPGVTTVAARVYILNSEAKIGDAAALLVLLLLGMIVLGAIGMAIAALQRRRRAARRVHRMNEAAALSAEAT